MMNLFLIVSSICFLVGTSNCLEPPNYLLEDGCPTDCICSTVNGQAAINCASVGFTSVPEQLNPGAEILDLRENRIRQLNPWAFGIWSLPNLRKLHLQENRLYDIHRDAFSGLKNLTYLDLAGNKLVHIHVGTFSHLPNLVFLNLSYNFLHTLSSLNSLSLRTLVMTHCKISTLKSDSLEHIPRLENLDLSWNPLEEVQPPTSYLLKILNISYCLVKEIPEQFMTNLENLEVFNVTFNPLQKLVIRDSATLKTIDVSQCSLQNLSTIIFANLPKLKNLKVSWRREPQDMDYFYFHLIDRDHYELRYEAEIQNFVIETAAKDLLENGNMIIPPEHAILIFLSFAISVAVIMVIRKRDGKKQKEIVTKIQHQSPKKGMEKILEPIPSSDEDSVMIKEECPSVTFAEYVSSTPSGMRLRNVESEVQEFCNSAANITGKKQLSSGDN